MCGYSGKNLLGRGNSQSQFPKLGAYLEWERRKDLVGGGEEKKGRG